MFSSLDEREVQVGGVEVTVQCVYDNGGWWWLEGSWCVRNSVCVKQERQWRGENELVSQMKKRGGRMERFGLLCQGMGWSLKLIVRN